MRRDGWMLALVAIAIPLLALNCDPLARRRALKAKHAAAASASASAEEVASAPTPPPKKKKPECESFEDKCVARGGTRVPIGKNKVTFQAPDGWSFVKGDFSIVRAPEEDVVLGFVEGESAEPDSIVSTVSPLIQELNITGFKDTALKPRLKKAQTAMEAGGSQVKIWEVDKASNGNAELRMKGEPGNMVVFVAELEGKVVVGVAFMQQKADKARGAAAGEAVQTLRSGK